MMVIHASNVEPLPHPITAVYETTLPRQPLRLVLANAPGVGKTIMAGLYIRELIMRADARWVLIVAPGSLVEQRRNEMYESACCRHSLAPGHQLSFPVVQPADGPPGATGTLGKPWA
jgi:hypothetical protein